jgi:NitT/TauT family transport system permease protein
MAGFSIAAGLGLVLGYLMGYSLKFLKIMDPLISSLRQIPLMAWVPLSIFWFGLGDGPTVFLIAMSGLFPMTLAVVIGVQDISHEYYDAARSLGAGTGSLLKNVVIPGSIPSIMTGMRLAMSAGWMSVI